MAGGMIHGQVCVPPDSYLIRAVATCKNVVSDWAWTEEGCGKTVSVNIVIPNAIDCLLRTILGIQAGTVDTPGGEAMIRNVMPKEVGDTVEAMKQIVEKLPASMLPHPPTLEELEELHKKRPKKGKRRINPSTTPPFFKLNSVSSSHEPS